jgi:hypothetical protein
VLVEAWVRFFPCWNGFVDTAGYCCDTNVWASASQGNWWVGWSSGHRLHGYFAFCFSVFLPPSLLVGLLSPLPFYRWFFFLSGCWVAFGFIDFTLCTSEFWVGGAAETVVSLAIVCCIDNYCIFFVSCSAGLVFSKPTIPSACGPTLCLVL